MNELLIWVVPIFGIFIAILFAHKIWKESNIYQKLALSGLVVVILIFLIAWFYPNLI